MIFLRWLGEEEDYGARSLIMKGWVEVSGKAEVRLGIMGQQKKQKKQVLVGWAVCLDCVFRIVILFIIANEQGWPGFTSGLQLGLSGILEHCLRAPCFQDNCVVFLCLKFLTSTSLKI